MKFLEPMIIAFSMYSKIPMPRIEWNKENMKYTMCFFPLIGVVTGAIIYLAGMFLDGNIFSKVHSGRLMFAAIMTLIPVFVSGGIHLDGFMDTMDALGSWGDKEKKLEILKDSHNGAFAVIGICCYFTGSLGVWSEIRTEMLPVVAAGYVISRALSGLAVMTFPAARGSGLVKTFQDGAQKKAVRFTMIVYLILVAGYLYICSPVGMVVLLIIAGAVFGYYYQMSRKQFGGVTGDLAGYFLQICELALLVGGLIVQNGRAKWEPELVIVSPLRRCRQTAEILFPGAEQVVCDKMRECDFGLFEGKNYQELTGNPKYQSWIDSGGTKAFPGGEDPMEFRKRCVCGFEEMMEKMIKGKRKKIAFVVHGGTIMSVMEAFDPEKKEFYHWQVKNGKGFHFQIEEGKWQQGNRQFEEIEEI